MSMRTNKLLATSVVVSQLSDKQRVISDFVDNAVLVIDAA